MKSRGLVLKAIAGDALIQTAFKANISRFIQQLKRDSHD
jgi:hypothetical protein